jgi:hypothetical protein
MLIADTMAVFFVTVGLMVSFVALWLLARALWPKRSEAAASRLERGLVASFLLGLPIALLAVVATILVAKIPAALAGPGAIAIVCLFVTYSSVGVSGLATLVGRRLPSRVDAESPFRQTVRGGIVLVLAFLMPLLGWFVILPVATIVGAGATTLGFFESRRMQAIARSHESVETSSLEIAPTHAVE